MSTSPTRALEVALAAFMVTWGVFLALPGATFQNPIYASLAALMPEAGWAAFSIASGLVRLAALYVNGAWRRTPLVRMVMAVAGVVWWTVLTWLFVLGLRGPTPAALAFYVVCIGAELYSCYRTGQDAKHAGSLKFARR